MTVSKDGLINIDTRKLADRINTELETFVGVAGVEATAEELNALHDAGLTNANMDTIKANIAEIEALTDTPVAGVIASESRTAILGEIASRLVAVEGLTTVLDGSTITTQDLDDIHTNIAQIQALTDTPITGVIASSDRTAILQEIVNRLIVLEQA